MTELQKLAAKTRKLVGRKLAEVVIAVGAEDADMGANSRADKLAGLCNELDKQLDAIASAK